MDSGSLKPDMMALVVRALHQGPSYQQGIDQQAFDCTVRGLYFGLDRAAFDTRCGAVKPAGNRQWPQKDQQRLTRPVSREEIAPF